MSDAAALRQRSPLVLADLLPGALVRDAILVVGAAGFVGLLAQISIHLSFTPVPITKGAQRDRDIDAMANRIVQTYLAASPAEHLAGQRFYSRNAHGAARALAAGFDPESDMGRFLRTMPSPAERHSEWDVTENRTDNVGRLYAHRERHEAKVRQAAGALARLSPQTSWESNVAQAHEVYHLPDETVAGLFHDRREPLQTGGRGGKPMALNKQTSRNIIHAHAIATGKETPEENITTGTKRVKIDRKSVV